MRQLNTTCLICICNISHSVCDYLQLNNLAVERFFFHSLKRNKIPESDGWMKWDFTSFSTVFQSYQDDGGIIMKGCVQWNPV